MELSTVSSKVGVSLVVVVEISALLVVVDKMDVPSVVVTMVTTGAGGNVAIFTKQQKRTFYVICYQIYENNDEADNFYTSVFINDSN